MLAFLHTKKLSALRVHVNTHIMYVGGGGWQEVLGQLRLCPASADHISSIHPCHEADVACMFACLTFLCNENSICGTSDMVDVSCLHYLLFIQV